MLTASLSAASDERGRAGDAARGAGAGRGGGGGRAPHARRAARHAVAPPALRRRAVSRRLYSHTRTLARSHAPRTRYIAC